MRRSSSIVRLLAPGAVVLHAACGAVVRPDDGGAPSDVIVEQDTAADDSRVPQDVGADVANVADVPDAGRLRNESRVVFSYRDGLEQGLTARLFPDVEVPNSIDSRDGACRTYRILELPETRAGVLTVRFGSRSVVVPPDASRERFLYTASFMASTNVGTTVQVDAEGSSTFPAFSLSERVPRPIEMTQPVGRSERLWSAREPITIRWQSDNSTDVVQVILLGRISVSEASTATVCSVPITQREFVLTPSLLQRFDALPEARRVDVYRVREVRGVFGNAPIRLEIRNENDGANWISFR